MILFSQSNFYLITNLAFNLHKVLDASYRKRFDTGMVNSSTSPLQIAITGLV